ncbi:MAG: class I SAM-dependent methyltransferase [Dokdonella sp.]
MAQFDDRFQRVRDYYDDEYYQGKGSAPEGALPWHYRVIARRLGDLRERAVLDVACGSGEWLGLLAGLGAKPAGIDISTRAIEMCRQRFVEGEFAVGPAESLPFADASFDLVTCMGSLEHFLDPDAALREMLRVAKPAAQFLLLVPNAGFLTRRLGLYGGTGQTRVQEVVRTLDGWKALFENAGMRVTARWRDLHMLTAEWILRDGTLRALPRLAQAALLPLWPLGWQYQVHHLCVRR